MVEEYNMTHFKQERDSRGPFSSTMQVIFLVQNWTQNGSSTIRNVETKTCLDTMGRKSGENLGMTSCHNMGGNQVFAYTKRQQIMSDDNCLDASDKNGPVKLVRCHGMAGNQAWLYDDVDKTIKHVNTGRCLQRPDPSDMSLPLLRPCNNSPGQQWIMESDFTWQAHNLKDSR